MLVLLQDEVGKMTTDSNRSLLIEIATDGANDLEQHRMLLKQVALAVSQRGNGVSEPESDNALPLLDTLFVGINKGETQ